MAQIQSPETYVDGQQVTAARLNNQTNGATLLPGVITDQSALAANTVDVADTILIHDTSVSALRKATVGDLLGSGLPVTLDSVTANSISADSINGKANKDVFIVPNDGVAVTGKTFSSIDGISVAVSSLSHGLVVGQYVEMTCSNTAYSGLYRIASASTNDFSYTLNATITAASGTCSYIKKASVPLNGNMSVSGDEYVGGNLTVIGDAYFKSNTAVKLPSGTTAQRPAAPIQGQIRYNTTTSNTEIYNGTTWEEVGGGPFDATGGNKIIAPDTTVVTASFTSVNGESVVVTSGGHSVSVGQIVRIVTAVTGYSGDYQVIAADSSTFTYVMPVLAVANSGSCTFQKAGNFKCHIFTTSGTFTVSGKGGNVEVLAVGGGGGGGSSGSFPYSGGGGGGGAVVYYPYYSLTPGQVVNITVGTGGAASTNGTASTFGTISAGGGGGASGFTGGVSGTGTLDNTGNSGTVATWTPAGGYTVSKGGGGGGAGGPPITYPGNSASGLGGPGKGSSIIGIPQNYGGGGSCQINRVGASDGGGGYNTSPSNGGGGASASAGAAGIVIVRYPYWL